MPNDPFGMMPRQMATQALEMNRLMSQTFMQSMNMAMQMNPLNVIASMMQGSGMYSAKMSTEQLKQRNIFGEA